MKGAPIRGDQISLLDDPDVMPPDPKPYYEDGACAIYHGDCRTIRAWLAADVLLTDPPYGVAYISNRSYRGPSAPIAGDGDVTLRDRTLALWGDGPALVFGSWRAARPDSTRHLLIWDKGDNPGMGDLGLPWGNSFEMIFVLGTGWTGRRRTNVLSFPMLSAGSSDRPNHPTPKPVGLIENLLARCPAGVIADPFMGSGTTLVAAKNLGRKAIGVEIEERYCEMAARRLAQEVMQLDDVA